MEIFNDYMKDLYYKIKDLDEKIIVCSDDGEMIFMTKTLRNELKNASIRQMTDLLDQNIGKQFINSFKIGLPASATTMLNFKRQTVSMAPGQSCMIIRFQDLCKDNSDLLSTDAMSMVEHEVRCALASMSACVDYLKKVVPAATQDKTISKNLSVINKGIYRVVRVVEAIADISRYNRDDLIMDYDVRDLTECLNEVAEKVSDIFKKNGMTFITELPKTRLITVFDPEKIKRMLYNVLNNACKAKNKTNNNVYMGVSTEGKEVKINIKYGIDDTVRSNPLYEPTVRFAIASDTAKLHKGSMTVTDTDKETDVMIVLPLTVRMDGDIVLACNMLQYVAGFDTFKLEMSDELDSDEF